MFAEVGSAVRAVCASSQIKYKKMNHQGVDGNGSKIHISRKEKTLIMLVAPGSPCATELLMSQNVLKSYFQTPYTLFCLSTQLKCRDW
jgi:hypothetical protein